MRIYTVLGLIPCVILLLSCQTKPAAPATIATETLTPATTAMPFAIAESTTATPTATLQKEDDTPLYMRDPAQVDNSKLPITPLEKLNTTGSDPGIAVKDWRLIVEGWVEKPLELSYEDILSRPVVTEVVLLICPGLFADNAKWTGVPLASLLQEAKVKPGAREVRFEGADQYFSRIRLEKALSDGAFLAYKVNGVTLPPEHGFPLRVVLRGVYGSRWVKWLTKIQVVPPE